MRPRGIVDGAPNAFPIESGLSVARPGGGGWTRSYPPAAGTPVPPGTPINLVLCAQLAAIPEPSSLALFAVGLGLLILFTWSRRRLR